MKVSETVSLLPDSKYFVVIANHNEEVRVYDFFQREAAVNLYNDMVDAYDETSVRFMVSNRPR